MGAPCGPQGTTLCPHEPAARTRPPLRARLRRRRGLARDTAGAAQRHGWWCAPCCPADGLRGGRAVGSGREPVERFAQPNHAAHDEQRRRTDLGALDDAGQGLECSDVNVLLPGGAVLDAFAATPAYSWLSDNGFANARAHGWLPSYPDGVANLGPNPEVWEFVWVGTTNIVCIGFEATAETPFIPGRRPSSSAW